MANKKVPVQGGEGPADAAGSAPAAVEYAVEELTAGARTVFPGISPDCVTAALRLADVTRTTREKAEEIVGRFVSEPVPGPKKGGN